MEIRIKETGGYYEAADEETAWAFVHCCFIGVIVLLRLRFFKFCGSLN